MAKKASKKKRSPNFTPFSGDAARGAAMGAFVGGPLLRVGIGAMSRSKYGDVARVGGVLRKTVYPHAGKIMGTAGALIGATKVAPYTSTVKRNEKALEGKKFLKGKYDTKRFALYKTGRENPELEANHRLGTAAIATLGGGYFGGLHNLAMASLKGRRGVQAARGGVKLLGAGGRASVLQRARGAARSLGRTIAEPKSAAGAFGRGAVIGGALVAGGLYGINKLASAHLHSNKRYNNLYNKHFGRKSKQQEDLNQAAQTLLERNGGLRYPQVASELRATELTGEAPPRRKRSKSRMKQAASWERGDFEHRAPRRSWKRYRKAQYREDLERAITKVLIENLQGS